MSKDLFDKKKRILILVESPEKSKVITKIFKDAGYTNVIVKATIGHFTIIKGGDGYCNTGIYPEKDFEVNYVVDPKKKDVFNNLREQVKLADLVYLCTDPDREGEAIAWSCVKFLKIPKSKYKRATYQAINQKAIFEAIENARDLDMNLVNSAHARGALDKGLGYRLSELSREEVNCRSVGRCQSPTLKIVVDRDREILNFKPEKYFDLYLHFIKNNVDFKAKYVGTRKKVIKRLNSEDEIESIYKVCKGNPFIVEEIEFKDKYDNPRPPFSTATFQQECASKLGLSIKQSADCAQQLFDDGKISYHRTDSEIFEKEFEDILKDYVKDNFDKKYVSGKVVKGKNDENSQEGHEALHVLDLDLTPDKFAQECHNDLLVKVYRIIYNRTVATALNPAIISQTTYNIYCKDHKFVLNSRELKFDGYKRVYSYKDDDEDKDPVVKETFSEGEQLKDCSFESVPKETQPPKRYSEAALVKELKELGIGRPSTYPSIIETIKSETRGYCQVENKLLVSTAKGQILTDFLDKNFNDVVGIGYTSEMEKSLDLIAQGKLDHIKFLHEFFDNLEASVKKVSPNNGQGKICPECGSVMKLRKGRYGMFWGCSNYPKCNHIENIKKNKA